MPDAAKSACQTRSRGVGLACLGLVAVWPAFAQAPTPRFEASATPTRLREGETLVVTLTARWPAESGEVRVRPPGFPALDGLVARPVAMDSRVRDGERMVEFRAPFVAERPGRYEIDPIEVRWTSPGSSADEVVRLPGVVAEVAPARPGGVVMLAAGAGLLAVAAVAAWWARARRRRRRPPASPTWDELAGGLREARRETRRGDPGPALRRLAQQFPAWRERVAEGDAEGLAELARLDRELGALLERSRYGGGVAVGESDRLLRRAGRLLDAQRSRPEAGRRAPDSS